MIGLLQRVSEAAVRVDGGIIGEIGPGLLVLIGVQKDDNEQRADRLMQRLLGYRVFPDGAGRMNRSLQDIGGGLLLVPQFTLPADTHKGTRPGFSTAAPPEQGRCLFHYLLEQAVIRHAPVAAGRFGADMQVSLVNDGPVTFWLET
ncbi:MAG TPA: D-tyrosyl-tRNA(Tyr) deacylase [Thiolapillus brandeum]|uniref:D-aminoacyl-tRNA deacylase n=1 Tax=Thiolapillus brandeum TaxID=1076588 RepID=A0A831NZI3_9GAMM|nr:D-tyrosyl-tRNA(Tyr) deacylase [Thiolapillus brandeum]